MMIYLNNVAKFQITPMVLDQPYLLCLLKKSKNDAIEKNGNLVVYGNRWHFEGGGSSYSSAYTCEEKFIEKVKAHNKLKNENTSKTNTDAI